MGVVAGLADAVQVKGGVVDLKAMTAPHRADERRERQLTQILHPLAARADEVMMMLGNAGDIGGDVAGPLDTARGPLGHLRLERAVDRREADPATLCDEALVQLLCGYGARGQGEGRRYDGLLLRQSSRACHRPMVPSLTMRIILM